MLDPELPGLGELDRREPTKCAVGSLVIVLVPPVLEEDLRLEETVELLTVQELVTKSTVKRFDPAILPGRAGIDEERSCLIEATPVVERVRHELWSVIHSQEVRCSSFLHQFIESVHHVVGGDRTRHVDREALSGELVDDVEHLDGAQVARLVELKVHCPVRGRRMKN